MSEPTITAAYEEVDESPVEAYTSRGFEARRILQCDWQDRLVLAGQLRGGLQAGQQGYTYTPPQPYPHYTPAVVADVRIEPFGAPRASGVATELNYELARLTVEYRIPERGSDEQALVSESLEAAAEFLTLPAEKFYWDSQAATPISESEAPAKLLRMLDWVYIRHQLVEVPSAVLGLVGCVNASAVTSTTLGLTFPAETLLYNPPRLQREFTTEGAKAWSATFRFTYRPDGWNKFPRRGSGVFQNMYDAGGQVFRPYTPADFTQLVV